MAVNPENVDFTSVEDVTDFKPMPTVAVSDHKHYFGKLGAEGKALLTELLETTSEDEPFEDRVFGRLGVDFSRGKWKDLDLFWADDENELVGALNEWKDAREIAGPAHKGG